MSVSTAIHDAATPPLAGASSTSAAPSRPADAVLLAIPLVLSAVVYFPIVGNYFFADDFITLFNMRNQDFLPFILVPRGGHLHATFYTFFTLWYRFFGTNPEPYFWVSLLTHLVNVGLLFSIIRLLTQSTLLACFGATLWGASPMNESALGWLSVFAQAIVSCFMLFLLRQIVLVANGRPVRRYAPALWCVVLLAACTCFGTGIGVTLAFPAVAFLLLPASPTRTRVVLIFCVLAVVLPVFYFGLTRLTTALYMPRTAPVFFERNLVTNLLMLGYLVGYGIVTLLVGHLTARLDYPSMVAFAVIGLFAAALIATLIAAPWPVKRRVLACVVLALGCYGIIVVGRAAFFALAKNPQAYIRAGRYHYAGPIPLAIALCLMLAYAETLYPLRRAVKTGLLAGWIGLAWLAYVWVGKPIDHHANARRETTEVMAAVRQTIAAAPPQQDVYIPNRPFQSVGPIFVSRQDLFPGWAGIFVIFSPDNVVDGKRIHFVTADRETLLAASEGHRTATLIVEPPER